MRYYRPLKEEGEKGKEGEGRERGGGGREEVQSLKVTDTSGMK